MTERGKKVLAGIETADSVVLDPHKGLFLPYGTGSLLVKNAQDLLDTHAFTSEYMPQMTSDLSRPDFCDLTPELSRGNRSLRLWMPIKAHGISAFRDLLDEKLDLINWIFNELVEIEKQKRGKIEVVTAPELSILSFRVNPKNLPPDSINRMNQRLVEEINASGRIMVTGTTLYGNYVIRICVLSFRTHFDRMEEALDIIQQAASYVLDSTVS